MGDTYSECALCGEAKVPEGDTRKGRFYCTCGREWILEKRKIPRIPYPTEHWGISEAKTKLVLDSLALFNSTLQLDELVENFCEFIHQKMEERSIGILLIDVDRLKISPAAYKSNNPISKKLIQRVKFDYDRSYGILVRALKEARSYYYNLDTEDHPFYKMYSRLANTKSQLILPIVYNNTPLGIITVDYSEKDVATHEQERSTLELLTGQFAVALRNSFLYDRSKKQSAHFQNLHLSALTLSKLYLDNHEEMIRMILLTASSFVDSETNYLYEVEKKESKASQTSEESDPTKESVFLNVKKYNILKESNHRGFHISSEFLQKPQAWKPPFSESGFRDRELCLHFESEEKMQYFIHLFRTGEKFTRDDYEVLNAFSALAKITIDNTRLYRKMSEQKKIEREIEIAREIQINLLPKTTPRFPGYEFAGIMEPARGVGGDYYDFIVSPEKEEVVICIGDVSGKGVGAGMVMATVRTILHSLVRKETNLVEILSDINTYLYYNYKDSVTPRFMTMTIMDWDPSTGKFMFAGAGHGSILKYSAKDRSVQEIETRGIVLGIQSDIDSLIFKGEFFLEPGDSFLLYTDGVTEAMNERSTSYEDHRLIDCYIGNSTLSAEEILQKILWDVNEFTGKKEQHDDVTMICIKRLNEDSSSQDGN